MSKARTLLEAITTQTHQQAIGALPIPTYANAVLIRAHGGYLEKDGQRHTPCHDRDANRQPALVPT